MLLTSNSRLWRARNTSERVVIWPQMKGAEHVKRMASSSYLTLAPGEGLLMHCVPRF